MNITRDNYEAWFLDYTEGNLSETQQADLQVFLNANADLKAEFEEDFDGLTLEPETLMFVPKDDLKKELEVGFVNASNVDYYLIAQIEGLLSQAEEKSLAVFLQHNPQYQKEQQLYRKTILKPNLHLVFNNKKALKRSVVLIRSLYVRYAAAAAVLLMFVFAGWQIINFDRTSLNGFVAVSTENNSNNENGIINAPESNAPKSIANDDGRQEKGLEPSNIISPKQDITPSSFVAYEPTKEKAPDPLPKPKKISDNQGASTPVLAMVDPVNEIEEPSSNSNIGNTVGEVITAMNTENAKKEQETSNQPSSKKQENNLLDYAGKKVKQTVLAQENTPDGKLRENDLVAGLTRGLGKVTNANVAFEDKSNKERVSYGFSIGNFEFSRTRAKK